MASKIRTGSSRRSRHQPYERAQNNDSIMLREVCLEKVQKQFPGFIPRNDVDLFLLAAEPNGVRMDKDDMYGSLDRHYALVYPDCPTLTEGVIGDSMKTYGPWLDGSPEIITGLKPHPRDKNPYIRIRPIPNSKYSIRVFPGCPNLRFFCIDLLVTSTGRPVKLPDNYELWSLPPVDPMFPAIPSEPLEPYERKCADDDQKFLVRDGQRIALIRSGEPEVRFTVPMRPHRVQNPVAPDIIELDFS
ncbi:hypothetical protein HGRIS_003848 [Hohenbuehelia grisea]|uniref:Uncharacterized protein n=1 Tax=Hohenbuehelia grisea TaxID=104357 RepID=A0ABR3JGT1_9AGAR